MVENRFTSGDDLRNTKFDFTTKILKIKFTISKNKKP